MKELNRQDRRIEQNNARQWVHDLYNNSEENKTAAANLYQEGKTLDESLVSGNHTMQYLDTIIDSLHSQGDRLKGVRRNLTNMAHTLGLSDSVIRMINRRETGDRYLVLGLMLLTVLIIIICWWFLL